MTGETAKTMHQGSEPVEPTLQFFILCDNVAQAGSKPVFVGIFDNILRPGAIPQFIIAMRWINGFGRHTFKVNILDPDLNPLGTFEGDMELQHRAANATAIFNVVNFVFPAAGVYWFEVLLNGKPAAAIPLPVQKGA